MFLPFKRKYPMRFVSFLMLVFSFLSFGLFAQTPMDTITNVKGERVVIFSDRSEMKLADMPFNGVMNEELQNYLSSKNFNHIQRWDNEMCFTSSDHYGIETFNDTLDLALTTAGEFVIPVPGVVTSTYKYRWRRYHKGIDLNLNTGDPVSAAWEGKVRYAQYNRGGYGNLVIIRHKNGLETLYAHLSRLNVKPNDDVRAGDIIGFGGSTGHSTGPHLHFEVRFFDASINPEEIINFETRTLKKDNLLVYRNIFKPGALPSDYYQQENISENTGISVAAVASVPQRTATTQYYKVKDGDTLSKIAARNNTSINALCKLNGIRQNTILQVGRRLRIR